MSDLQLNVCHSRADGIVRYPICSMTACWRSPMFCWLLWPAEVSHPSGQGRLIEMELHIAELTWLVPWVAQCAAAAARPPGRRPKPASARCHGPSAPARAALPRTVASRQPPSLNPGRAGRSHQTLAPGAHPLAEWTCWAHPVSENWGAALLLWPPPPELPRRSLHRAAQLGAVQVDPTPQHLALARRKAGCTAGSLPALQAALLQRATSRVHCSGSCSVADAGHSQVGWHAQTATQGHLKSAEWDPTSAERNGLRSAGHLCRLR